MAKFNTELAIAEMDAAVIVIAHNLRYARQMADKAVIQMYHQELSDLVHLTSWVGHQIAKREKELRSEKK